MNCFPRRFLERDVFIDDAAAAQHFRREKNDFLPMMETEYRRSACHPGLLSGAAGNIAVQDVAWLQHDSPRVADDDAVPPAATQPASRPSSISHSIFRTSSIREPPRIRKPCRPLQMALRKHVHRAFVSGNVQRDIAAAFIAYSGVQKGLKMDYVAARAEPGQREVNNFIQRLIDHFGKTVIGVDYDAVPGQQQAPSCIVSIKAR